MSDNNVVTARSPIEAVRKFYRNVKRVKNGNIVVNHRYCYEGEKKKMTECKCITCEHCLKWCTGKQTQISCKGDKDIIYQYWTEYKINKDFGFIGYMKQGVFPIKKTPKWCPKEIKEK